MSDIVPIVFGYADQEVRFVGTPEIPEWIAADVVAVLYPKAKKSSYNKYLGAVQPEWKGKKRILTPGGYQEMITLFEPGLYCLIGRSNSPFSVPFQRWIFQDVLPSIRKTGEYKLSQREEIDKQIEMLQLRLEVAKAETIAAQKQIETQSQSNQISMCNVVKDITQRLLQANVRQDIAMSFELSIIAKTMPEIAPEIEQTKKLMSANMVVEEIPFSPTEIGKKIAESKNLPKHYSNQKINIALEKAGLQVPEIITKKDKRKKIWKPTEAGEPYSILLIDSARGNGKTVYSLRWFSSVIPLIEAELD